MHTPNLSHLRLIVKPLMARPSGYPPGMARSSSEALKSALRALKDAEIGPNGNRAFAAKAGIGEGTVARARTGEGNTTLENLDAMARVVRREAWELLTPDFDPKKPAPKKRQREEPATSAPTVEVFDVKISIAALELARAWEYLPPDRRRAYEQQIVAESLQHRKDYVPDEKLGHLAAPTAEAPSGPAKRRRVKLKKKPSSGSGTN